MQANDYYFSTMVFLLAYKPLIYKPTQGVALVARWYKNQIKQK